MVARANALPHGSAAYVHTRDVHRAHRVARALEAGTVTVNGFPSNSPTIPFGGVKASGFGREGGREGIEEFLRPKNVLLGDQPRPALRSSPMRQQWSGRRDLNPRPRRPERRRAAKLRHFPVGGRAYPAAVRAVTCDNRPACGPPYAH